MLKKIFLIRHAEAALPDGGMKDFDRPLTALGIRDATNLGKYLYAKDILPDVFLSSSAIRTRQTSDEIAIQIKYEMSKISFKDRLYEPSVRELLLEINQLEKGNVALMVSHNPSISYLAEYLSGEPIGNMPPGGCVELDFPFESWAMISEKTGDVITNYVPS